MSRKKPKDPSKSLLGDLESIRVLLNEETALSGEQTAPSGEQTALSGEQTALSDEQTALSGKKTLAVESKTSEADQSDPKVPLLDEVVVGGTSQSKQAQTETHVFGEQTVLGDDLFQALLGDEWSTSTALILEQARESLEQHDVEWTPDSTDELNEALKVVMDETVHAWLHTVIVRQVDELRSTLLKALSQEIASNIKRLSDKQNSEGADGK